MLYMAMKSKQAGPVQYRWMYLFEWYETFVLIKQKSFLKIEFEHDSLSCQFCRYMFKLQSYDRSKSQPEGLIVDGT